MKLGNLNYVFLTDEKLVKVLVNSGYWSITFGGISKGYFILRRDK
jgi:hypothetical protein